MYGLMSYLVNVDWNVGTSSVGRDQRRKMQYRHFKFLDWRRSLYTMLFDWSVQNSIIIFADTNPKFEHCHGKAALCEEIMAVVNAMCFPSMIGPTADTDERKFLSAFERFSHSVCVRKQRLSTSVRHMPNTVSRQGRDRRKYCHVHPFGKKTNVYCTECHVFLCAGRCFSIYHCVKDYKRLVAKYAHLFQ